VHWRKNFGHLCGRGEIDFKLGVTYGFQTSYDIFVYFFSISVSGSKAEHYLLDHGAAAGRPIGAGSPGAQHLPQWRPGRRAARKGLTAQQC
jgi:hypothetical protein